MKRYSDNKSLGTLSELNVTPLLDLAFVLLIIFMITTPLLSEGADLIIPTAKASRDAIDPNEIYKISINNKKEIKLNDVEVGLGDLDQGIRALKEEKPGLGVVIEADHNTTVQELVGIMDVLTNADVTKVAIVTLPEQP